MITFAVMLILYNTKENISYFYIPSELNSSNIEKNKQIRIGGFVEKNSFSKISASSFIFKITDNKNEIYSLLNI